MVNGQGPDGTGPGLLRIPWYCYLRGFTSTWASSIGGFGDGLMTWDASNSILATAGVFVSTSSTQEIPGKMNIHEDERADRKGGSETGKG